MEYNANNKKIKSSKGGGFTMQFSGKPGKSRSHFFLPMVFGPYGILALPSAGLLIGCIPLGKFSEINFLYGLLSAEKKSFHSVVSIAKYIE